MAKPIRVLLYYKYLPIENAEQFAADHLAFCKSIGLKYLYLLFDSQSQLNYYSAIKES